MKNIVLLSGLPRSGSTLLANILCQNPIFFHSGNSPLCQLMWDFYVSYTKNAYEQTFATGSIERVERCLSSIPQNFYNFENKKIIIDKCKTWGLSENISIAEKFINEDIKTIVVVRDIYDIVQSFIHIWSKNNMSMSVEKLFTINTDPLMLSIESVINLFYRNKNTMFISYDKLILNPKKEIERVYLFLGIDQYSHFFSNIIDLKFEDDLFYGIIGYHEVRPKILKRKIKFKSLNNKTMENIIFLQEKISPALERC